MVIASTLDIIIFAQLRRSNELSNFPRSRKIHLHRPPILKPPDHAIADQHPAYHTSRACRPALQAPIHSALHTPHAANARQSNKLK
jgi:hypothetical protein